MVEFVLDHLVVWVAVFSLGSFLLTLVLVPWLIVQLPSDYFINEKRKKTPWVEQHFLLRCLFIIVKNLLGYIIIAAGIVMLVLPGQGLLSIIIGIILVDFPGKFAFERWLIQRGPVLRVINKLRCALKKSPFIFYSQKKLD